MLRVLRPGGGRLAVAVWDALDRVPGYLALTELLRELFGRNVADAMHAPFTLGDPIELRKLFVDAGAKDAEVQCHRGSVRFASIDAMISTERACVWTLGGMLGKQQFAQLRQAAVARSSAFRPEKWKRAVCVSGVDCFLGEGMMSVYGICLEDHAA